MVLEPIIYKKTGGTDYSSYPIGSIILSASQDIGEDWLRCDGSYINESTYPELTAYLGKNVPGVQDAVKGGSGAIYNGTFSTSYNFEGYTWVYWLEGKELIGFPISGDPELEISFSGEFDFVWSADTPVVLSICGGRAFLCQTAADMSYMYVYSGEFTTASSVVTMSKLDTSSWLTTYRVSGYSSSSGDTQPVPVKIFAPEVVLLKDYEIGGVKKDYFAIFIGEFAYKISNAFQQPLALVGGVIDSTNVANTSRIEMFSENTQYAQTTPLYNSTLARFSRKLSNEFIFLKAFGTSASGYYYKASMVSKVRGTYQSTQEISFSSSTINKQYSDPILVSPIANDEFYIYRAYIKDHQMYIRAGQITPFTIFSDNAPEDNTQKINGITLSPYAQLFPDSFEYVSSHNMFVIFVGTGILFSHTPLDVDSWGYLDTVDRFGVISQWGNAEFNVAENTLCLSGRNTYGDYVVGLLRFHEHFDYSNDGAWLPYIASDGIPAWIRAKGTVTGGGGTGGGDEPDTPDEPDVPKEPLPNNALRLQYIDFSNTRAQINTGIQSSSALAKIDMNISILEKIPANNSGIYKYICSTTYYYVGDTRYVLQIGETNTTGSTTDYSSRIFVDSGVQKAQTEWIRFDDAVVDKKIRVVYDGPAKQVTVDGKTETCDTAAYTLPELILGYNPYYTNNYSCNFRLYSCKIYNNGTLVRDFEPCIQEDNTVSLYDNVSGEFFSSANATYPVVAGPLA